MNSIFIDLGFIQIYWYSITMLLAILTGSFLFYKALKRKKISDYHITNILFYAILFGILGARTYYVLFNLDYYLEYPIEILEVWNGGLAIHGAIIGGLISIFVYCKKHKINILKITDAASFSVIIAQAIGRWGNFFNQEAFGSVVSRGFLESLKLPKFIIEGMHINGNYYHPTFLYESVWNIIGFIIMIFLRRRKYNKIGEISGFYLIWYSFARFFIESLRMDSLMLGPIRIAQLVSFVGITGGIIFIVRARKGSKFDNLYNKEEKDETRF